MADRNGKNRPTDRERETLDQFADRFGQLADRYDQAVHPALERTDTPTAEHPDAIAAREADQVKSQQEEPHHTWPDERVKPDFERAVTNEGKPSEYAGKGSKMVQQDQPEHNVKPPENSEDQDRATHRQRMAHDDARAKRPMTDQYYNRLAERLREAELDKAASGQDQSRDRDQGYDHSR